MAGTKNRFESRVLICKDCKQQFVFTAAAQEYFARLGYTEDPQRCKTCHTEFKKQQRNSHPPTDDQRPTQHP